MAYYILTHVAEREISTESFKTLSAAQKRMNSMFMGFLRNPKDINADMADGSIDLTGISAYINYENSSAHMNMDWTISFMDAKGVIHALMPDGSIINETKTAPKLQPAAEGYDRPASENTGHIRCRVYGEFFYTAELEIPSCLTLQQAISYAETFLDTDEMTIIDGPHNLPGSEEFDDEDRQNPDYFKFV